MRGPCADPFFVGLDQHTGPGPRAPLRKPLTARCIENAVAEVGARLEAWTHAGGSRCKSCSETT